MNLQIIKKDSISSLIVFLCSIFILYNCQPKSKKVQIKETAIQVFNIKHIKIDRKTKIVDEIKLSDIADSVEYIPLETSNEILVSKIQGIKTIDSLILIRDKGRTFLFNSKGRFIKSLYTVGKGPGEAYGTHVTVDRENGDIYVGNRWTKKVMKYSTKGKFRDEKKYKHFVWQFYFLNNMFVFAGNPFFPIDGSFFVQYINTDSVCYKHPFRYSHLTFSQGGYSNMYVWFDVFEENILFKEQVCDTIFSTTDFKTINAEYVLDFGVQGLNPEDFFSKNPNKFDNKQFITAFKEKSSFLLMKGVDNNELCQFLYDKRNEKILKSFELKMTNDIDGGPPLHYWEIHNSNYDSNILYFYIDPFELLDDKNKPLTNGKLEQITKSININNNQILVKAYLKK